MSNPSLFDFPLGLGYREEEDKKKAELETSFEKERLLPKLWKFSKNFVEYVIE